MHNEPDSKSSIPTRRRPGTQRFLPQPAAPYSGQTNSKYLVRTPLGSTIEFEESNGDGSMFHACTTRPHGSVKPTRAKLGSRFHQRSQGTMRLKLPLLSVALARNVLRKETRKHGDRNIPHPARFMHIFSERTSYSATMRVRLSRTCCRDKVPPFV